ncbi:MAG: glycosyltransferase family 2 protein [Ferruginibacter sp.]|nr:glycosyltransferase family 2 protein [Ferruginibacter sp.]
MDKPSPLVSVLMTVFNRELYIRDAIESVLNSKYTNFELIIVDDCSTDSSVDIARYYEQQDSRIKVYVNDKNLTDYPNRNCAAEYAKGKYIKYLDSDDVLYPYGLDVLINRMEAFPEVALGLVKLIGFNQPFPIFLTSEESYRMSFLSGKFLFGNAPSSVIIRRDAFESLGRFSGLNQLGDMECWLKMAASYPVLLIEGVVAFSRDHPQSEKYKDNEADKDKMRYQLKMAALKNTKCPLNDTERINACNQLERHYKIQQYKHRVRGIIKKFRK